MGEGGKGGRLLTLDSLPDGKFCSQNPSFVMKRKETHFFSLTCFGVLFLVTTTSLLNTSSVCLTERFMTCTSRRSGWPCVWYRPVGKTSASRVADLGSIPAFPV